MKKIFYSLIALALLTACSNEDVLPESPTKELVRLESVDAGSITRGAIDRTWWDFSFTAGDQVLVKGMTIEDFDAYRDDKVISNTFTYDGVCWTQDKPTGYYKGIYVQDEMKIVEIRSYGGFAVNKSYNDQSTEERYVAADELKASIMDYPYVGEISTSDYKQYTVTLEHMNADFVLKVYDGYDEKNTLVEDTPVLKVIVDEDGSGSDSKLLNFTAWNAGKSTDSYGTYTLFRVQLPAGCSILEAELSNANETAGGLKTDIHFRARDGQPSNEIDLEAGRRYSSSYTYDMLKTVATVDVSIAPFEDNLEQDITVTN